jgi:hypothetical protein
MSENQLPNKDEFLSPRSRYYGDFTPENLIFNANLQEFANQIGLICSLETGGKISGTEAYRQIKQLFKSLKKSSGELGIDKLNTNDDKG